MYFLSGAGQELLAQADKLKRKDKATNQKMSHTWMRLKKGKSLSASLFECIIYQASNASKSKQSTYFIENFHFVCLDSEVA